MEDLILRADNVSYAYEDSEGMAVRGVTLGFRTGEMTAVLGHNGSGKSTLAKLLNGLYIPTEGHVTVCGMDTQEDEHTWDIRRSAGMVFQNPDNQLVASIVRDDVAFGLENMGLPQAVIRRRVAETACFFGIEDWFDRDVSTLSGGQQQRAAKQQRQHTGGHPWHGAVVSSQQRACGQAAQGVADAASQPYASVRDGTFLQRLQDQTVAQRLYAGIKQREQAADNRYASVAPHQPQQAQ